MVKEKGRFVSYEVTYQISGHATVFGLNAGQSSILKASDYGGRDHQWPLIIQSTIKNRLRAMKKSSSLMTGADNMCLGYSCTDLGIEPADILVYMFQEKCTYEKGWSSDVAQLRGVIGFISPHGRAVGASAALSLVQKAFADQSWFAAAGADWSNKLQSAMTLHKFEIVGADDPGVQSLIDRRKAGVEVFVNDDHTSDALGSDGYVAPSGVDVSIEPDDFNNEAEGYDSYSMNDLVDAMLARVDDMYDSGARNLVPLLYLGGGIVLLFLVYKLFS